MVSLRLGQWQMGLIAIKATFRLQKKFNPINNATFVLFSKYCPIVDQLGSKDSSRDFQLNGVISFFYLHLLLHVWVQRLMWWRESEKISTFGVHLNKAQAHLSLTQLQTDHLVLFITPTCVPPQSHLGIHTLIRLRELYLPNRWTPRPSTWSRWIFASHPGNSKVFRA
jgi:hypothetical protein